MPTIAALRGRASWSSRVSTCAGRAPPRTLHRVTKLATQIEEQKPARQTAGRQEGSAMKTSIKVLGLSLGWAFPVTAPATAAELKLMTGPQGGVWVPLGGQLKDLWEKAVPGLAVQSLPG